TRFRDNSGLFAAIACMLGAPCAGFGSFRAEKVLGAWLNALLVAFTQVGCGSSDRGPGSASGAPVHATVAGTGGANAISSGAGGAPGSGGTSAPAAPLGGSG